MKTELKQKAIKLRQEGYSLSELNKILGVSKGTLSLWVRNIKLSNHAQARLLQNYTKGQLASQNAIKEKTLQKNLEADNFATDLFKKVKPTSEVSLLLCTLIYQCEGSKSIRDSLTFTNSDPVLIKTFLFLLRKSFKLDESKFRVLMHLHDYHSEKEQKDFWAKVTGISPSQFLKTYNKKNTGLYKKEGYQGCIQIRYRDAALGRKISSVAKTFMERYK